MTDTVSIIIWSFLGSLICAAAGFAAFKSAPENIAKLEKLTRNRYIGLVFGWFALFVCVPHAGAVAPGFLLPFLYPLAVITPILGFFFVDYPASRAVSGTLILCAYYLIHLAFDHKVTATALFAVCGWSIGAFAVWCSGMPWVWRDIFRRCSKNKRFRLATAIIFWLSAAVFASFAGAALI